MPGGGEREVDRAEQQIGETQADHEGGGGVDPQLDGAGQGDDGDQVAWRRAGVSTLRAAGCIEWRLRGPRFRLQRLMNNV